MNIFRTVKFADLFTAGNLCCGVLAIFNAANKQFILAVVFILLALVLDTLDGKVAKLLKQANLFGKQLDSFADLISFGVAPAVLYYSLHKPNLSVLLILILFTVSGMLRLARYNITEAKGFEGVPITVNGFIFPGLYLLYRFQPDTIAVWPFVYALMSVLMVSSIHVKRIF